MNASVYPRKNIAIRLLYTIFFLIVFEILKIIVQVSAVFQYIYLLVSKTYNTPVRYFTNKVSVYAYRILRYVTLNENKRPFPFQDFPKEFELPEAEVYFE